MPDSSLRDRILALMRRADYRPMDKVELSKKLNIHSSERRSVRDVLQELETSGAIARIRKDRYILPVKADLVTGTIHFHLNGNAHVIDERTGERVDFVEARMRRQIATQFLEVRHGGNRQLAQLDRIHLGAAQTLAQIGIDGTAVQPGGQTPGSLRAQRLVDTSNHIQMIFEPDALAGQAADIGCGRDTTHILLGAETPQQHGGLVAHQHPVAVRIPMDVLGAVASGPIDPRPLHMRHPQHGSAVRCGACTQMCLGAKADAVLSTPRGNS